MKKRNERTPLDLPIVAVTWRDHTTHRGWRSLRNAKDLTAVECRDVGYFVERTKAGVTLAGMASKDGDVCNVMTIPGAWIERIRRLR